MGADFQANYEQLTQIQSILTETAEGIEQLERQLTYDMDDLRNGWEGDAARAFFSEMEADVLPGVKKLSNAFYEADRTVGASVSIIRGSEQESTNIIQNATDSTQATESESTASSTQQSQNLRPNTPASQVHTVQPGDNLTAIAQRYNTTVDAILGANNIANPDLIYPGQEFIIPGATEAPTAPAPTPSGSSVNSVEDLNSHQREFVGKKSNRMQGWGCVAHTLENHYLPWVDSSTAPGNANVFAEKARAWSAANPEYGVVVNSTPAPGAIAVFPNWGEGYGHVGTVTAVDSSNQYTLESGSTWHGDKTAPQGSWYNSNGELNGVHHSNHTVETSGYNTVEFIHLPWSQV